jgi:hypothetical protein
MNDFPVYWYSSLFAIILVNFFLLFQDFILKCVIYYYSSLPIIPRPASLASARICVRICKQIVSDKYRRRRIYWIQVCCCRLLFALCRRCVRCSPSVLVVYVVSNINILFNRFAFFFFLYYKSLWIDVVAVLS